MNNEQVKELTITLARSSTEDDIVNVLKKTNLWEDESLWKEFDSSSGNWSTIGNQQSEADSALVEKIINSVDAVLIRECLKSGIDPESSDAPNSIEKAQNKYFNIYNGKLSSIDASQRANIANNIYLVATGSKTPSLDIIDLGEGQSPSLFKDTFLSLNRGNKSKMQFVQGKFGMGGTGVFSFGSKEHNIQLIISKRNQELPDSDNRWGVTVIRRIHPTGQMKSSVFKYLAPEGDILSFVSETLPLLPGDNRKPYSKSIPYGSFIKIYDYRLKTGRLKSDITRHLWNRLSLLMPDIALPIKVVDTRQKKSPIKTLAGLSVRLDENKKDLIEPGFPGTGEMLISGQKIDYSIYAFKHDDKKSKKETYAPNEGVIFTVNGQTQGSLSKAFFTRKSVQMGYLSDSILITLNCSKTDRYWQEDLFMNSRDRLRSGQYQSEIEKELEKVVKSHPGLKALREERRRKAIENRLDDSKPLAEILEKIINKSPALSSLLLEGKRIANPFKLTGSDSNIDEFKGKENPSYFKLVKEFTEDKAKKCEFERRFRVQFETDAENDYFNRDVNPGKFILKASDKLINEYSINLWRGIATLNIAIPNGVIVGDEVNFITEVVDETQINAFENDFWIKVVERQDSASHTKGERKKDPGSKDGSDRKRESGFEIPSPISVTEDNWNMHNFDKNSALKVVYGGEDSGYDFYINVDNIYLKSELKNNNKVDAEVLKARFKFGMTLIGLSMLNNHKKDDKSNLENSVEDEVFRFTSAISPILLPMIGSLGDLELE